MLCWFLLPGCAKSLQSCLTLGTAAHQAPLSMGFSFLNFYLTFIYLFLAVLGLRYCADCSSCDELGLL